MDMPSTAPAEVAPVPPATDPDTKPALPAHVCFPRDLFKGARGTVVEDRIRLTPWYIERLSRPESAGTLRRALLQQIGVEAANLARVRVTLAADHLSGILEARLLVAPGPTG